MRVGDALTRATTAVGVRPCAGCKRRAERLNRAFARSDPPSAAGPPELGRKLIGSIALGACALGVRRWLRNTRT